MDANYDLIQTGDSILAFLLILVGGFVVCWILVKLFGSSSTGLMIDTEEQSFKTFKVSMDAAAKAANSYHAATKLYLAVLRGDKRVMNFSLKSLEGVDVGKVSLHPDGCVGWNIVSLTGSVLNDEPFTSLDVAAANCPDDAFIYPLVTKVEDQ